MHILLSALFVRYHSQERGVGRHPGQAQLRLNEIMSSPQDPYGQSDHHQDCLANIYYFTHFSVCRILSVLFGPAEIFFHTASGEKGLLDWLFNWVTSAWEERYQRHQTTKSTCHRGSLLILFSSRENKRCSAIVAQGSFWVPLKRLETTSAIENWISF